jgi:hypothetical protein
LESARLLRQLHALFVQGIVEGDDAESIRDCMDAPWYAMTPQEQERVGGLSEDLYALAEAGPPCVPMNNRELEAWKHELAEYKQRYLLGDFDGWLAFWRKPRPNHFPAPDGIANSVVHFIQAQCWDKLGDHETAALFKKAAENLVLEQLTPVA